MHLINNIKNDDNDDVADDDVADDDVADDDVDDDVVVDDNNSCIFSTMYWSRSHFAMYTKSDSYTQTYLSHIQVCISYVLHSFIFKHRIKIF